MRSRQSLPRGYLKTVFARRPKPTRQSRNAKTLGFSRTILAFPITLIGFGKPLELFHAEIPERDSAGFQYAAITPNNRKTTPYGVYCQLNTLCLGDNILDASHNSCYSVVMMNERRANIATQAKQPETLMQAVQYFSDPDRTHEYALSLRWPDGVKCPHCESDKIGEIKSRRKFQCKSCRKQFSVKVGTIFEDSALGMDKWLCTIWLLANAKNGISSYEVGRSIGVTQKSAWFMLQRIRLAMQTGTFDKKLDGEVEVDETFIGGKARFMHTKRRAKIKGRAGTAGKVAVMGLLERNGNVRTEIVPNVRRKNLDPNIRKHVDEGSTVYTDALASYESIQSDYIHKVIDHAECYAKGTTHTNGMENYWSLLKRSIKGTYVSVEPFHLFRYLDEQAYRFNGRKLTDRERFDGVVGMVSGKRLTYQRLIGEAPRV